MTDDLRGLWKPVDVRPIVSALTERRYSGFLSCGTPVAMVKILCSEDAIRQQTGGAASIFKTRLRDVDPFGVAQDKPCGKIPLRQGLWIED